MRLYIILFLLLVLTNCKDDDETIPTFVGELNKVVTIGGSSNESIESIIKTSDNGYACIGYTQSSDGDITEPTKGINDYWIVKLDQNLNVQWDKTFGGSSDDKAKSIIQTADNGYIISGFTKSDDFDVTTNYGQKDYWIIKLDSSGNLVWEKSFGFSGQDESFDIIPTHDGGFFTCGFLDVTSSGGEGNDNATRNVRHGIGDYWTIKLDANGEFEWRRYFGGSQNDRATSAIQTANGDFILTGSADSDDFDITNSKGSDDIWVIRISGEGNLLWEKSFGGNQIEDSYKVIETRDGNYFIIGGTLSTDQDVSNNLGANDIWLLKIDPQGNLLWENTYGGNQFDNGLSIIALQDGNYLIAGHTRSDDVYTIKGQNDALFIKIDANGNVLSSLTFGGNGIDVLNDLIETNDNKIIGVGNSTSNDQDITNNNGFTDALILEIK